jgi:hypothetical protein
MQWLASLQWTPVFIIRVLGGADCSALLTCLSHCRTSLLQASEGEGEYSWLTTGVEPPL